jgi:hypothetical protein
MTVTKLRIVLNSIEENISVPSCHNFAKDRIKGKASNFMGFTVFNFDIFEINLLWSRAATTALQANTHLGADA